MNQKKIYVVTQCNGHFDDIICAFETSKEAQKYCRKRGEGHSYQKVKVKESQPNTTKKKVKCPKCGTKSKKHNTGGFIYDMLICKNCGWAIDTI